MQIIHRLALTVVLASLPLAALALQTSNKSDNFETLLQRGFELHRQQQYRRSVAVLEQAHALRPEDYFANLLLGIDYLRLAQTERALTFLVRAREARPSDPTVLGYLAETYADLQQFDRAAEVLQDASNSRKSPENNLALVHFYLRRFRVMIEELRLTSRGLAYAYRLQALVLHARRDPKEREALLQVQKLAPQFPGLQSALGHEDLLRSQFQQAESHFVRAQSADPNDLDAVVGKAVLAVRSGDLQKAETHLIEVAKRSRHRVFVALREWPSSVALPLDLKHRLTELPKQEAVRQTSLSPLQQFQEQRWESLVEALSSKTQDSKGSLWLGTALARLERYDTAIPPLERAWQEPRQRLEADYWLSFCYARSVEEATRRIPSEGPDRSLVHVVRGEVLLRLAGDGAAATSEYRQAIAAYPRDPALWAGLAAAQLLAGDSAGAKDSARRALQLDPHRTLAARTFAEAAIQEREYSPAISPLRQVLQIQPEDLGAQILLGTAYSKTGDDQQALHWLKTAVHQGYLDEKGTVHYLMGTILRRLGYEKEAEQAFQEAQVLSDAFSQSGHGPASRSK
jgi:tetratricopeptide (TPR) repeat protein